MNWTEMKAKVALQMARDPQRATLSTIAITSVESGLQHLIGVGFPFEIAPRGTLAQLTELQAPPQTSRPLSISDGVRIVEAEPRQTASESFEARTTRSTVETLN